MTKMLQAVAIVALLLIWGMTAVHWGELPARYPIHFNAAGVPNLWSTKLGSLILPVAALGMFLLFTFAERRARRFNVPFPINQDSPEVRAILRQFITAIKAIVLVMLTYLQGRSMAVATGRADGLGLGFLPMFLAVTCAVVIIYLLRLRRFRMH